MWFLVVLLIGFASYDIGVVGVDGVNLDALNAPKHNVCKQVPDSMGPDPVCAVKK